MASEPPSSFSAQNNIGPDASSGTKAQRVQTRRESTTAHAFLDDAGARFARLWRHGGPRRADEVVEERVG